MSLLESPDTVAPTGEESMVAAECGRRLAKYVDRSKLTVDVVVQENGKPSEVVVVPMTAFRLFTDILTAMARGDAVTLIPLHAELTTQQAADLLNVSRPFFITLLEGEQIPYHRVGTHRRVKFADVVNFKNTFEKQSRQALATLVEEGQNLNME
jgi:excisionase family DNA binding protein